MATKYAIVGIETGEGQIVFAPTHLGAILASNVLVQYTSGDADLLRDVYVPLVESGEANFIRRVGKSDGTYPRWNESAGPVLGMYAKGWDQEYVVYPTDNDPLGD